MNVLMIGPDSEAKGGMASVIANFKQHFDVPEVKISYLTTWEEGSRWKQAKRFLRSYFELKKYLKTHKNPILHFHVAQRGSFFRKALLLVVSRKKGATIWHMHASEFKGFYKKYPPVIQAFIRWTLNQATCVVALNPEWQTFYQQLTATKVMVIFNAVDTSKKSLFCTEGKKIITLGRIGKRKGSFDILQVAKKIGIKYPDYTFVLYGDGEMEEVAQQIKEDKITNVYLGGWIDKNEQKKVLEEAILHLLPSYNEGMPMAVLETMAAGIPNIASKVGGIPQVINEKNGYLVTPGDVEGITQTVSQYLACEKKQKKEMSKEARKIVAEQFSFENYIDQWRRCYQDIEMVFGEQNESKI